MKKKLLYIILVLIFTCSVFLVACDEQTPDTSGTPSNTSTPTPTANSGTPGTPINPPDTGTTTDLTLSEVQSILTADIFDDWQGRKIIVNGTVYHKDYDLYQPAVLEMIRNEDTLVCTSSGSHLTITSGVVTSFIDTASKLYVVDNTVYRQQFESGILVNQDSIALNVFLANSMMYGMTIQSEGSNFQIFKTIIQDINEVFESATKTVYSNGTYKIKILTDKGFFGLLPAGYDADLSFEFVFNTEDVLVECIYEMTMDTPEEVADAIYKAEKYNEVIPAPDWLADFQ